ncbi:PaaI family thioesterase [uncultured Amaricoccus sp.]|uniref:PaaI family thioesterase n=1 Tax=uncultured Amaricoccus sp. TaxID=339341 RepID=UPI0026219009|nr:PaaI family thioesterase [uncultured Amaricoccus sp.]
MELKLGIPEIRAYMEAEFPQIRGRFELLDLAPGFLKARMAVTEADLRPGGTISGPSIFALVDCAFYMATLAVVGREALAVTTSCAIDFMRKPAPGDLVAEARVLKLGRALSVGDVLVFSPGVDGPVARAGVTFSIPPKRGAA